MVSVDGDKPEVVMECSLKYVLAEGNVSIEEGEGQAVLDKEAVWLHPRRGLPMCFSFRDIVGVKEGEYSLSISLASGETLSLTHLGSRYDPFLNALYSLRNEMLLKDMLMHEALRNRGVQAHLESITESGQPGLSGACEVSLYETGMVIMPRRGDPIRVPYGDISSVNREDYSLTVETDFGERFFLSRIGKSTDFFEKALSEAVGELAVRAQAALREILPGVGASDIRRVSTLMKDGRAVSKHDLDLISPAIWREMENRLVVAGMEKEYRFLCSMKGSDAYIGFKRGLLGDVTGDYIWFLVPIYSAVCTEPGNAIAMEAGGEGSGRATYFFKIVPRSEYPVLTAMEERVKEAVSRINRCMVAINFRREPIYISEERLKDPKHSRYLFTLKRLPALGVLRAFFIGRVAHTSPEQWEQDVTDLLRFNVSAGDEREWRKRPEE